ncbi:hypothetical protein E9531_00895 [Lampropedia puyangensis]|uniref:Uncharacterized protein n=1 Tax=Lampropedia puyangensis TaxID=1330072 RepID=A0A4S8FBX6_9BURK|nr:hypothetical protein [Lampropedia puyangensis]THU05143.1 hypothetical protein E9531_00895 [Lampropedia puyangensis]
MSHSTPVTSIHRKLAIAGLVTAALMVVASIASLAYAFTITGPDAPHWPAVMWQICQMLAIIAFAFGMWQSQKHRRWKVRNGLEEENQWD